MTDLYRTLSPKDAAPQSWATASLADRQRYLSQLIILHPRLKTIVDDVERAAELGDLRGRGSGVYVEACSGIGKTTACRAIALLRGFSLSGNSQPTSGSGFAYLSTPPARSAKGYASWLLTALGDPAPSHGALSGMDRRIYDQIRLNGIKVIAFDNMQDLPAFRRQRGIAQVGAWLRDLIDGIPGVVVCLGTPDAQVVLHEDEQLARRLNPKQALVGFDLGIEEQIAKLNVYIRTLLRCLPIDNASSDVDDVLVHALAVSCNGSPAHLYSIAAHLVKVLFETRGERVSKEALSAAFLRHHGTRFRECNPFEKESFRRPLIQPNEPFDVRPLDRRPNR